MRETWHIVKQKLESKDTGLSVTKVYMLICGDQKWIIIGFTITSITATSIAGSFNTNLGRSASRVPIRQVQNTDWR